MTSSPAALARARSALGHLPQIRKGSKLGKLPPGYPPRSPMAEKKRQAQEVVVDARHEGAAVYGRAAIVAAAAAERDILPLGTTLRIWWEGSDDWFQSKVVGHRAQLTNGKFVDGEVLDGVLIFKHLCEYEGGELEHDLGHMEYEIIQLARSETQEDEAKNDVQLGRKRRQVYGNNFESMTRMMRQESIHDHENALEYARNVPILNGASKQMVRPRRMQLAEEPEKEEDGTSMRI